MAKEIEEKDFEDLEESLTDFINNLADENSSMIDDHKEKLKEKIDEIKNELARNHDISWYSVRVSNYGMLHSYSTAISTEKSYWIPFSTFE